MILKVSHNSINVSLSRWTLGFCANIVPLPYGQEDQGRGHYVQFCTLTWKMFD